MAGTGKSDIAKSIIRDLSFSDPQHHHCRRPQNPTLVLSYFFQLGHTSSNLAQGLLSQLVQAQPSLVCHIEPEFTFCKALGGLFNSRNEARLWKILHSSLTYLAHDDVCFVINALHQYSGDVLELYGRIKALASSNGRHSFKVVLTSRPLTLWDRIQSSCDIIYLDSPDELRAINPDIRDFVPIASVGSTTTTSQTLTIPIEKP
uniref:Nephrocystin 3-like N-terminal domain-containing protein n=1 Tax=Bionectria ochroleuca TaxID=29856 RepID=A0A8H7K1L3_BIOOC